MDSGSARGRARLGSSDVQAVAGVIETLLDPLGHPDVDSWRAAVVDELQEVVGADRASFQLPWPGLDLLYSREWDVNRVARYVDHHIPDLNARMDYFSKFLELGVGNRQLLWRSDLPWLYGSEYYNEILRPLRLHDPVWAAAPFPGSDTPAVLINHRATRGGRKFGEREMDILRLLRPALEASVATLHRLDRYRSTLIRTIDHLPSGLMVVDERGTAVHRNPAMGRLVRNDPEGDAIQAAALGAARSALDPSEDGGGGPTSVSRTVRTQAGGYRVLATRVPDGVCPGPSALVLVERESPRSVSGAEIQARWGLTPRQAEVAGLLALRRTNDEIAGSLRISPSTARRHTEAVMLLMNVSSRRQVGERVASLGRLPEGHA